MRNSQRAWHQRIWLALGPLTLIGLAVAIAAAAQSHQRIVVLSGLESPGHSSPGSPATTQPENRP